MWTKLLLGSFRVRDYAAVTTAAARRDYRWALFHRTLTGSQQIASFVAREQSQAFQLAGREGLQSATLPVIVTAGIRCQLWHVSTACASSLIGCIRRDCSMRPMSIG